MGIIQSAILQAVESCRSSRDAALVDGLTGRSVTFGELISFTRQLRFGLEGNCGLKPGETVAIYAPNMLEWAFVVHATLAFGCVFTACSLGSTTDELVFQLRDSEAVVLFTIPSFAEKANSAAAKSGVKFVYVFGGCEGAMPFGSLLQNGGVVSSQRISPTTAAIYSYSPIGDGELEKRSASHADILDSIKKGFGASVEIASGKKPNNMEEGNGASYESHSSILGALPFWRIEGLVGILLYGNCTGNCVYVHSHFNPSEILQSVRYNAVKVIPLSLPMIKAITLLPQPKENGSIPLSCRSKTISGTPKQGVMNDIIIVVPSDDGDACGQIDQELVDSACRFFDISRSKFQVVDAITYLSAIVDPGGLVYPNIGNRNETIYMLSSLYIEGRQRQIPPSSTFVQIANWSDCDSDIFQRFSKKREGVDIQFDAPGKTISATGDWGSIYDALSHAQTATFGFASRPIAGKNQRSTLSSKLGSSLINTTEEVLKINSATTQGNNHEQLQIKYENAEIGLNNILSKLEEVLSLVNIASEQLRLEKQYYENRHEEKDEDIAHVEEKITNKQPPKPSMHNWKEGDSCVPENVTALHNKHMRNESGSSGSNRESEHDEVGKNHVVHTTEVLEGPAKNKSYDSDDNFQEEIRNDMILLMRQGRQYVSDHCWHKALPLFEEAIELADEVGDRRIEAQAKGNLATVFESTGQHHEAIEAYLACIETMEQVNDKTHLVGVLYNLSFSYLNIDQFEEAISCLHKSLNLGVPGSKIKVAAAKQLALVEGKMQMYNEKAHHQ